MKNLLMIFVAIMLVAACATPEERAARQAENLKMVKASVGSQKYRINVRTMTPMRGMPQTVTNRWLIVDSINVDCSLPYLGREDIPHLKTRGEIRMDSKIEFKSEIQNYILQYMPKKKCGVVTFKTLNGGEELKFSITIDNLGSARIRLTPKDRDYIDYDGSVYAL